MTSRDIGPCLPVLLHVLLIPECRAIRTTHGPCGVRLSNPADAAVWGSDNGLAVPFHQRLERRSAEVVADGEAARARRTRHARQGAVRRSGPVGARYDRPTRRRARRRGVRNETRRYQADGDCDPHPDMSSRVSTRQLACDATHRISPRLNWPRRTIGLVPCAINGSQGRGRHSSQPTRTRRLSTRALRDLRPGSKPPVARLPRPADTPV